MSSLLIINGGLLSRKVTAIVNDTQPGLHLSRSSLSELAGPKLQDYCDRVAYCPVGSAVITPAFEVPARYIIHAVPPIYQDGQQDERRLLRNTYRKVLELAEHNACHSVMFPLLGIRGFYPVNEAWECALHTCYRYIYQFHFDIDIYFSAHDDIYRTGIEIDNRIDPAKAPVKLYEPVRKERP